jgi:hypothetical protein
VLEVAAGGIGIALAFVVIAGIMAVEGNQSRRADFVVDDLR